MNIVKGRQDGPVRALCYGPEKVGKTTFASMWPKPLFVDADHGTRRMDVERVCPQSWSAVLQIVDDLTANNQGYRTLVLDTCDWLEYLAVEHVLATVTTSKGATVTNIEGYGWGAGYVHVNDAWKRLMDKLALLQDTSDMHVLLLAHASMRRLELPEETGSFDRWELKCMKQSCGTLKEWPEMVLFLNYETIVVTMDNGKRKAQGGSRVVHAAHHPCWDAGNRFGLPDKMNMPEDRLPAEIAALLADTSPAIAAVAKPGVPHAAHVLADTPKVDQTQTMKNTPVEYLVPVPKDQELPPERVAKLWQLKELMDGSGVSLEELQAELHRKGVCPAGMNPRDYNDATLDRIIGKWQAVAHNIGIHKAANPAA